MLAQASHLQTKIFYVYVVVTYMEKTVLHSEVSGLFLRLDAPKKNLTNDVLRTVNLYASYFSIAATGYIGLCLTAASS